MCGDASCLEKQLAPSTAWRAARGQRRPKSAPSQQRDSVTLLVGVKCRALAREVTTTMASIGVEDTVLPSARAADCAVGACQALDASTRVLFCVPRFRTPSLLCVAFPGDNVPYNGWQPLPGALNARHLHGGGLLGAIHDRFRGEVGGAYADAAFFVVEPLCDHDIGYAKYSNLLPGTLTESGEVTSNYDGRSFHASTRLSECLDAALTEASRMGAAGTAAAVAQLPAILLGFSKGGVVLNQMLAELSALHAGAREQGVPTADGGLLTRLVELHYLDAGVQGRGAHLTDPAIIDALGRRSGGTAGAPSISLHGTPRQWADPQRPWLREEKDRSVALLRAAGLEVFERLYFRGEPPSLAMHFDCVTSFSLPPASRRREWHRAAWT